MGGEDRIGAEQREVAEVLVIDGVELVLLQQSQDVWELERHHAAGCQKGLHPRDEVVEVGHLSQNVVGDNQVGEPTGCGQSACALEAKEVHISWHTSRATAAAATFAAGSIPRQGTPRSTKNWSR